MKLNEYLRAERGRTNRIAKAVGVSPEYLSQIASGRKLCPTKRAPAIEQACNFEVRRQDLCDDWHVTWPELAGAEGAVTHQRARKGHGRRATDMRSIRAEAGLRAVPSAPLPAGSDADGATSVELLRSEVLRMAAQAAEVACRTQELTPEAAALAVVEAFMAARKRLDQVET
jgi:DNA-binding transcriptional regulator YdaS (Cro superfamily)